MKRKTKKFLSVLMCAVIMLTAFPMSAFAVDENVQPYCEIKLKEGCSDKIKQGETTEIYIEYSFGDCEEFEIQWSASGNMCEYEYITDNETGLVTGMKITSVSGGMFYVFVSILDSNGNELAKDHIEIWSSEPDNKPLNEKVDEFIDMLPAKLGFLGYALAYMVSVVVFCPISSVVSLYLIICQRIEELRTS